MSGRDPSLRIPEDFQCDYAPKGQRACSPAICDCFVGVYNDDPFGLHPEAFRVAAAPVSSEDARGNRTVFCADCGPVTPERAAEHDDHHAGGKR